jgi:hypothetical protein
MTPTSAADRMCSDERGVSASYPMPTLDLIVVCSWSIVGLIVTALVARFGSGADLARLLEMVE